MDNDQPNRVSAWQAYSMLSSLPEGSNEEISKKLLMLWSISDSLKIDRVRIWNELARIERLKGNSQLYCTYKLRILRALGEDRFGDLNSVCNALTESGYPHEALAAQAMYGAPDKEAACIDFIHASAERCRSYSSIQYEKLIDWRKNITPRVSIIVSMYNAAPKLKGFLQNISNQTLLTKGELEIILIDSGSPLDELRILEESLSSYPLPILYARTKNRETIQTAWNRGIELAKAPYIAFLGVDEGATPECYAQLASVLDADSYTDWVTADAIVNEVNAQGEYQKQVGWFNRSGYHQGLVSLETGYLSWVGALYRRSIHERFGYYDGTFRAAGDTEFKSRVLPFIKSKAIPENLGIFFCFPEVRTTESAVAEIEDLRAWYLYRGNAGVKYSLEPRNLDEIELLFRACLHYRKSFRSDWGTDLEYATSLLHYLRERAPESFLLDSSPIIENVRKEYQGTELLGQLTEGAFDVSLRNAQRFALQSRKDLATLGLNAETLGLFTDNRWHQHYFPWTK